MPCVSGVGVRMGKDGAGTEWKQSGITRPQVCGQRIGKEVRDKRQVKGLNSLQCTIRRN